MITNIEARPNPHAADGITFVVSEEHVPDEYDEHGEIVNYGYDYQIVVPTVRPHPLWRLLWIDFEYRYVRTSWEGVVLFDRIDNSSLDAKAAVDGAIAYNAKECSAAHFYDGERRGRYGRDAFTLMGAAAMFIHTQTGKPIRTETEPFSLISADGRLLRDN